MCRVIGPTARRAGNAALKRSKTRLGNCRLPCPGRSWPPFCPAFKASFPDWQIAALLNDPPPQLPGGFRPTQLFYFATPPISASPTGRFQYDVFERFKDCYVRAFYDLIVRCAPEAGRKLSVLYPSSMFVTDTPPNMGEYAASKAAGESLCAFLQSAIKGLHIHIERLPRLPTDQTASLIPARLNDPVDVMGNVLKAMARS